MQRNVLCTLQPLSTALSGCMQGMTHAACSTAQRSFSTAPVGGEVPADTASTLRAVNKLSSTQRSSFASKLQQDYLQSRLFKAQQRKLKKHFLNQDVYAKRPALQTHPMSVNLPVPNPVARKHSTTGSEEAKAASAMADPLREFYRTQQQAEASSSEVLGLKVGLNVDALYRLPSQVKAFIIDPTVVCLYGTDKNQVTQVASKIRSIKPPDAYKGSGIRIMGEDVLQKERKKVK